MCSDYRIQRIFEKATKLWEKDTCIDFRWNSRAPNRIHLLRADGCWSYVGKLNIVQPLSLGYGCDTVAIAAHEIGHALGLWHTQSRHDRDKFITFNAHNVKRSRLDQFVKESTETNKNYGITYDYGSIMHYGTT
ncbi:astacin, partial [Necator americanus]